MFANKREGMDTEGRECMLIHDRPEEVLFQADWQQKRSFRRSLLLMSLLLCGQLLPSAGYADDIFKAPGGVFSLGESTSQCLATAPTGPDVTAVRPDPANPTVMQVVPFTATPEEWQDRYTARMIYCMHNLLSRSTKAFLKYFIEEYGNRVLGLVAVLSFSFFGLRIMMGMERKPKREGLAMLAKLALILGVFTYHEWVVDFWFNTTDAFVEMVGQAPAGVIGDSFCLKSNFVSIQGYAVWDRFDCLYKKFVGFGAGVAAGAGILSSAVAMLFASGVGIAVGAVGIAAVALLAKFLFRSTLVVLLAYGGLSLLILVLPIFLPLILFGKATEKYLYRNWINAAMGMMLQPAITVAFLLFALTAMDRVMFNDIYIQIDAGGAGGGTTRTTVLGSTLSAAQKSDTNKYQLATTSFSKTMGYDATADTAKQQEQVDATWKLQQVGSSVAIGGGGSSTGKGFMEQNCGDFRDQRPSDTAMADAKGIQQAHEHLCSGADKTKCMELIKTQLSDQTISAEQKLGLRLAYCRYGMLSQSGTLAQSDTQQTSGLTSNTFLPDFNWQDGADGDGLASILKMGDLPNKVDKTFERMGQLLTSMGATILLSGVFLTFANSIPQLAAGLGANSAVLATSGQKIFGHTIGERMEGAAQSAYAGWKDSTAKRSDAKWYQFYKVDGTLKDRAGWSAVKGAVKGFSDPSTLAKNRAGAMKSGLQEGYKRGNAMDAGTTSSEIIEAPSERIADYGDNSGYFTEETTPDLNKQQAPLSPKKQNPQGGATQPHNASEPDATDNTVARPSAPYQQATQYGYVNEPEATPPPTSAQQKEDAALDAMEAALRNDDAETALKVIQDAAANPFSQPAPSPKPPSDT
jgi:hypothetical protein